MFASVSRWIENIRIAQARRRAAETLERLGDAQLLDIGLERGAIEDYVASGFPFVDDAAQDVRSFAPSLQGCG